MVKAVQLLGGGNLYKPLKWFGLSTGALYPQLKLWAMYCSRHGL